MYVHNMKKNISTMYRALEPNKINNTETTYRIVI